MVVVVRGAKELSCPARCPSSLHARRAVREPRVARWVHSNGSDDCGPGESGGSRTGGRTSRRPPCGRQVFPRSRIALFAGMTRESHRPCSGAREPARVAGSRVAGGHHEVTRSALDAVRRQADAQAEGRRRRGEIRGYLEGRGCHLAPRRPAASARTGGGGTVDRWRCRVLPGVVSSAGRWIPFRPVRSGGCQLRARASRLPDGRSHVFWPRATYGFSRCLVRLATDSVDLRGAARMAAFACRMGTPAGMGAGPTLASCAGWMGVLAAK
jgi:hypothetical protein